MSERQRTYRFYCPELAPGRLDLPADEARHAARVLRLRVGDAVELFDGRGRRAPATVRAVEWRGVQVEADDVEGPLRRARPVVEVAFAVPRGKHLNWLLEKCTELGAAAFQPVRFERSVAGRRTLGDAARRRWKAHCLVAAKQCGLDWLPALRDPLDLPGLLDPPCEQPCLLGDAGDGSAPLAGELGGCPDALRLLVGPEGGLTDAERDSCLDAGWRPVRLGETTLRIETAAAALLAGVRALTGAHSPEGD